MARLLRFATLAAVAIATPPLLYAWRADLLSGWWALATGALALVALQSMTRASPFLYFQF